MTFDEYDDYLDEPELSVKVLLADPDPEIRKKYIKKLKSDKFQQWSIFEANSGRETISLYDQEHPGCVLLNTDMSDLDGMKVLQYIQDDTYWNCAVILFTDTLNEKQAVIAIKKGASQYVVRDKKQSYLNKLKATSTN
ncbi:MAG: response regulator [Methylococcales bacterium]|jgi:DNA-binding NtrC family response regulator|nr:response regulator [Methylococcales bacterium]MBT7410935.1 response regulator [Methylococcales bacterium]